MGRKKKQETVSKDYSVAVINQHNSISAAYKTDMDLLSCQMQLVGKNFIKELPTREGAEWYEQGLVSHGNKEELVSLGVGRQYDPKSLGTMMNELMNTQKLIKSSIICPPGEGAVAMIIQSMYNYRTGDWYIKWNSDQKAKLVDMTGNFHSILTDTVLSFDDSYAINLSTYFAKIYFETLAKQKDPATDVITCEVHLHLVQIRLFMGLETDYTTNKTFMDELKKKAPDFDKLEKILSQNTGKYFKWGELKRKLLDPWLERINSVEDYEFSVEMEPIKVGTSHSVKGAIFYLKTRTDTKKYKEAMVVRELQEHCDDKVSRTQVRQLIETADGDIGLVARAYTKIKKEDRKPDNYFAYMKKMIVEGFEDTNDTIKLVYETRNTRRIE